METSNKKIIYQKGITLIALVITIIILLILASVTIAAISGDNGILSNAAKAKRETEIADIVEQIRIEILGEMADNEGKDPTPDDVERIALEYGSVEGSTYEDKVLKTTKGNYDIKLSEIWPLDETSQGETPSSKELEIGSIVKYNPDGEYKWEAKYYSSDNTDVDLTLDSSTDDYNIDTWRVLEIDEGTGQVTLVPAKPTIGKVELKGAQGYNNAVYLLNEACSQLYSNEEKGITARSINVEDIEKKLTDEALENAHSYGTSNAKYENQVADPYTKERSYYPLIYAEEKLSVIDGEKNEDGLKRSEQNSLVEKGSEGITAEGYTQAEESIQPYQTTWIKVGVSEKEEFKIANNGVSYYDLLMPNNYTTRYWLATRGIETVWRAGDFMVNIVDSGIVKNSILFYSAIEDLDEKEYELFPIVYVNSEVITTNESGEFIVE